MKDREGIKLGFMTMATKMMGIVMMAARAKGRRLGPREEDILLARSFDWCCREWVRNK